MTTKFTGNIISSGSPVATQNWVNSQGYGAGAGGSINGLSDVDTTTSAPSTGQVLKWDGSNWTPQADSSLSYDNASVDAHLNQNNPTSGHVLSWSGSDYAWVTNAGYLNSDVDLHLNQSNPTSGYVLSWNGSDYAWVAQTGSTDLNSLSAGVINSQTDSIAFIDANDGESSKKQPVTDFLTAIAGSGVSVSAGQLTAGTANNPGGADTQVQFNDSSAFGGDSDFTYNKTTNTLTVVNLNATSITTTGAGSTTISAGANVELNATNRVLVTDTVFRLASMTTTQRNAVASPVNGDMIYNSTTNQLESYENSSWGATAGSGGGGGGIASVVADTTPQLGGTLDANGNTIDMGANILTDTNLGQFITAHGWGDHSSAGYQTTAGLNGAIDTHLNQSNPTSGYVLSWNGSDYAWVAQSGGGGGIASVVADTTPQLGGDLDVNGKTIAHTFTLGANGASDYTFSDAGNVWFPTTENDPVLYLRRGEQYIFVNSSGGSHPFQIRVSNGGSAYNTGVTNNGASSGNIIFKVPMSAPATLYYQCTSHSGMGNTINIV
tara:strand:+ start:493 stop:2139 length:1647 start_codon:yes stop_codon:yes gene_type:complete